MDDLDQRQPGEDDLALFVRSYNEVLAHYKPARQSAANHRP